MTAKTVDVQIRRFIETYAKSKKATLTSQSNEIFTMNYPDNACPEEYTYNVAVAREKKVPLIARGSPTFQRILNECLSQGSRQLDAAAASTGCAAHKS